MGMITVPTVDREALAPIADGLAEIPEVQGAFAYSYGFPSPRQPNPYAIAAYLHDSVWDSRATYAKAVAALAAVGRRAIAHGLRAPNLFHFSRESNQTSHPAGVAHTLQAEAYPLSGAPIHRSLGWLKAGEATRFHAPVDTIQAWRSLAWTHGRELFTRPEQLDQMTSRCFELVTIACGAAGVWGPREQTITLLRRLQPRIGPVMQQCDVLYHKWSADPRQSTGESLRNALLLFIADLADLVAPLIRIPIAASLVEARRSAAKSLAPVITAEAEETALRVRTRLRSALLALLAVRTPFAPLLLVAVLDDLMPTPAIRLLQLASPEVVGTPVLFFRRSELPRLAVGALSEQYLGGTHLHPYLSTALIGGSRLLYGEELRPFLRAPDRATAVVTTISDLQLHLRSDLMLQASITGNLKAHSVRAAREMDHLLALGLWLQGEDGIDSEHLRPSFFRTYPNFPYRAEVMEADFAADHSGWCWAWELTASWLRSRAEASLPRALHAIVRPPQPK